MNQTSRPSIAAPATYTRPSATQLLDLVISNTAAGGFDVDAYHVMDRRDDNLISQEIINGASSGKFVYSFTISGKQVSGVSVVGARHLAYEYGGLRCTVLSSVEKTGNLWLFRTFPSSGTFEVRPERFRELEDEPDFYEIMLEISDIKTGNSIQVTKRESRQEKTRDGRLYDRPHYRTIAEAKAFRNGILSLLPQDVILKFKARNLPLADQKIDIGEDVISEKRAGVLQFAAAKGLPLDRHVVEDLTMDQIAGLAEAARTKDVAQFTNAATALGLLSAPDASDAATDERPAKAAEKRADGQMRGSDRARSTPKSRATRGEPQRAEDLPAADPETGEIEAAAEQESPPPVGAEASEDLFK